MKTLCMILAVIYYTKAYLNIKDGITFGKEIASGFSHGDVHILTTRQDVSLEACTKQCLVQPRCDFINYKFKFKMCYLIEHFNKSYDIMNLMINKTGSVFGVKAKWIQSTPAPNVSADIRVCGPPPDVQDTERFGNIYTPGSEMLYRYLNNRISSIICWQSGSWGSPNLTQYPDQCYNRGDLWVIANFCYVFLWDERATMNGARDLCAARNGRLPIIRHRYKQSFIEIILKTYQNRRIINVDSSDCYVWIGLSDNGHEGVFMWMQLNLETSFVNWQQGEPDGDVWEDCAVIWPKEGYTWADVICGKSFLTLCEINTLT